MVGTDSGFSGPGSSIQEVVLYTSTLVSDNQNVVRILYVGSRKTHLQVAALKIFSLSPCSLVKIEAEWIPSKLNVRADLLS